MRVDLVSWMRQLKVGQVDVIGWIEWHVESDRLIVEMIVVVTIGIHLYFRVAGWGKERGLYPPSSWCRRIRELEFPPGWILRIKGLYPPSGWS